VALTKVRTAGINNLSTHILAQQFRLAASQAGSNSTGTVLTNWEEADTNYQAIGSVWSQSSGIFSCSQTGVYLCTWALVTKDTTSGDRYDPNIQISTDSGSNYNVRSIAWGHTDVDNDGSIDGTITQSFLFDVANTSTFRLRYRQSNDNDIGNGTTILGNSSYNATQITFCRVGDT
jgi:hypothetical protein